MLFKTIIVLALVAYSYEQKIKYKPMTIGDTLAHPEMEIELSEPKPYDWKNQPAPVKPYISEFKMAAPADNKNEPEPEGPPRPFSFGFMSQAKDGSQSRMEQQDGTGKVTGSYSIIDADGMTRQVEYWADDSGFHADIKSNEPGLEKAELGSATISKL